MKITHETKITKIMHGKILETFYNDIPACPEEIRLLFWAEGRWIKNIYDGHSSN